jgi:transcriptional antiterminator Rof (Rho-off)
MDWLEAASIWQKLLALSLTLATVITAVVSATVTLTVMVGRYKNLPADYVDLKNGQQQNDLRLDTLESWRERHYDEVDVPYDRRLHALETKAVRTDSIIRSGFARVEEDHHTLQRMDCLLKALAKVSGRSPYQCTGVASSSSGDHFDSNLGGTP